MGQPADQLTAAQGLEKAVVIDSIAKAFGQTAALRGVSMSLAVGETRGLIGRNGAGKSTLVSILAGVVQPDSGSIRFRDQPAPPLSDRQSWRRLVGTVYQHPSLIEHLTVAENLFLATQPRSRLGLISWRETRTQARRLLDEWGLDIQETAEVSRLKLSERQLVEAARELARGARVVILDEPTSRLSRVEILRLYAHIKELQQRGVTMLYISHHLEEVLELCHTVTVLRDGRHVATRQVAETNQAELVEDMVGEVRLPHAPSEDGSQEDRDPVLEVEGLSAPGLASCSFVARGGELLGVAGLVGSGKEVVADLLSGNVVASGGVVRVDGRSLRLGSIATAMKAGIAYVPADRARDGLVASMTVAENVTMSIDRRIADSMGMIWPERRKRAARELMAATEMVAASPDLAVSALSGGNQQKVVIARALALRPRVLVLANPTTGVDVASKAVIYSVIDRYRREGMAILMISDELEEYLLCDRVLVLFKGAISKEFTSTPNPAMLLAAVEGID